MTAVERATEIICDYHADHERPYDWSSSDLARDLDDAGLLRPEWATDEAKAVLDMAVALRTGQLRFTWDLVAPIVVDAYVDSVEPK